MEARNELSDGQLRCRHYREHAFGRNSADVPVLRPALQRRELWSHIPTRQVRGIWHTSHVPSYTQNTKYPPVQIHVLVCVQQGERVGKKLKDL